MNFDSLAEKTILQISDDIEKSDKDYILELEYEEGVLTITTSQGSYVVNKNSSIKELWLSSPLSGAHHFKFAEGKWLNKKYDNILELLKQEIFTLSKIEVIWSQNG